MEKPCMPIEKAIEFLRTHNLNDILEDDPVLPENDPIALEKCKVFWFDEKNNVVARAQFTANQQDVIIYETGEYAETMFFGDKALQLKNLGQLCMELTPI